MQRLFILGAGASKAGGIPALKELSGYIAEKPGVARFMREIFAVNSQLAHGAFLPRLDDIYSVVDYALFQDHRLGSFTQEDLRTLRRELNLSICRLFAKDTAKADYAGSVDIYRRFARELNMGQDAVLTLNWDTALDYVLECEKGWALNYGFTGTIQHGFPLVKLHGSVNWAWCEACTQLNVTGYDFKDWEKMNCQTCGETKLSPLLVGPTVLPRHKDTPLENCWLAAIKLIIQAERLYFIGLSLDAIDLGVFEMIKRGLLLNKKKPELFVLGHGFQATPKRKELLANGTVKRYIQLFGVDIGFYMQGFQGTIPGDVEFTRLRS